MTARRSLMCRFRVILCTFLVCLGMSITVVLVIYLTGTTPTKPRVPVPLSCRPFSAHCRAFLPVTDGQTEWHRRDCQIEGYITNTNLQCSNLMRDLHFITRPLSREEEDYPLAFILTVHKELELLVRLLRAIYAPQNVYCIHVDAKAPQEYQTAVQKLVGCFKNVFLSSRSERVTYAGFSRLKADLNCMTDLAGSEVGWRKVVNLCGQDFPLKSNLELVRYLQSKEWRDKNMTPGIKQPPHIRRRTKYRYREIAGLPVALVGLGMKKDPPPHNLQIYFGSAYYALTRGFVDFVLESRKARDLLEWSRDTYSPDEHYWVTLNQVREAPGSNVGGGWEGDIRAIKWEDHEGKSHTGCKGRYVRQICIYGIKDLPWLIEKNSMFANKFENNFLPETLDCLEQWHRNKMLSNATVPIESSWLLATRSVEGSGNRNKCAAA
ncbi:beta-1,3-galactosyl-O-glycosyl-glycoprotein beta-1,6-N-acetylglucosaminyltransferase 7 [Syngnathoides biaculeatus]|uniref:beta-1,3-galactosyl-O-glycosyl-glycoprotein beta-1,6-N-acetylglucosaminyltransferase 7 n=1 Tax=Syngnathoides biaculeatus TaxID=300417 RepID=UPI002ADD890B|nr:beta-1,3-galactosyl-O-glycosyl-glycoprotein beta-1,6-N-acetylglucosaminyltransferase 7 [Syngnathoides biaculeatus]XP_061689516.1 beta-1,3-galactosyl-O-glycosyl-glycoprotein beta-1,6-N-acetylglucosaminyltransferase 7 [Syngnathoides biaculeatus]XP_061689518.1 beta-1,3-galactosyl-O-glycosyl-glycoprotein beta-1,6-N-acetylglucosaminyltransferase 7 [Syngnathoides biaculeatus]